MSLFTAPFETLLYRKNVAGPLLDIRASTTDYFRLMEIELIADNPSVVAAAIGLGVPATLGTQKNPVVTLLPEDSGLGLTVTPALPTITIANDWTVPPTAPTNFFRRVVFASATNLIRYVLRFPNGLMVAPSSSLVLWMTATAATAVAPLVITGNMEIDG